MNKEDICYMSACEMISKIQTQELSSLEITETIIERIEKINPSINAFCTPTFDLAREMAKKADLSVKEGKKLGSLNGIPLSIKDLMMTEGIKTTFGSKLYENFIPTSDDIAVQRLKMAGSVILGKVNTPEFGHIALTNNKLFGETKTPWDLDRNSGGSSGGSASAVASGLGPLSLASDGGGSIRIPSSLCGVIGLKTTYGRIPIGPRIGVAFLTLDHYGPIARNVEDAALMLNVMKGFHPIDYKSLPDDGIDYVDALKERPKKLKIGYSTSLGFVKVLDDEVENTVIKSAEKLTKNNWEIENAKIKLKRPELAFSILVSSSIAYDLKNEIDERPYDLSPDLRNIIKAGLTYQGLDIEKATAHRLKLYEQMHEYFKRYDLLITPTTPLPAFKVEWDEKGTRFPSIKNKALSISSWMSFTYPFNMTGHPAISIPCGWSNKGLPIGMQIVGKRYDEKTVLQVSKVFEEISPWQDKRPPLT
ncbi:MAG: amidase [Promethearchaeota archaeon]